MDPNANLTELRQLMSDAAAMAMNIDGPLADKITRAEELFSALDEWLSKGSFLPDDWRRV